MIWRLTKKIQRILIPFFIVSFTSISAWADLNNESCYSTESVYVPHIGEEADLSQYTHQLTLEEVGLDQLKFPIYEFIITQFDKISGKPTTKLRLSYGCTVGPPNCKVSFIVQHDDIERRESLDIVSLNKDFTQHMENVRTPEYKSKEVPYVIVFPKLRQAIYRTTNFGLNTPAIEYLTDEKIPLKGVDVWKFKRCTKD